MDRTTEHEGPAEHAQRSIKIRLPISQQELGQWAGLSREGTSKALRELRDLDLVRTGRQFVHVLDPVELRRLAALST